MKCLEKNIDFFIYRILMQIFVKLSGKSYVINCNEGDLVDSVIIRAFKKYIEDCNRCFYATIQTDYYNYLRSSQFNFVGINFRFGTDMIVTKDMDEHTIQQSYMSNPSKKFSNNDIDYISMILSSCKL